MTKKLLKDISASSVQIIISHILTLTVFLLTSRYLSKESYGELNWSVAVLTFGTTVLSLRLEQIVVKKTAAGESASHIMSLFLFHVFLFGTFFYGLIFLSSTIFPSFFSAHSLLLIIGISQLINFFSLPFRQIANGKERFDYLVIMSSIANLVRTIGLLIFIIFYRLSIQNVLIIFIAGSLVELVVSYFIVTCLMKIPICKKINPNSYAAFLKESLPQMGSAVLMAGIARMDWVLLGIFSSIGLTAEYSFAYRIYEFSPFPLLIIAPVLLSRLSKFFATNESQFIFQREKEIGLLIRIEMIAATLIPLILNIIWSPLIDSITDNKYGSANQTTFFILSCCLPFQYISNLLWSTNLAQYRLKIIFTTTLITFCIVLVGDILLIPILNVRGAAIVYLAAMIVEYINYMRSSELSRIRETWLSLLICLSIGLISGLSSYYLFNDTMIRLVISISLYFLLMLATRQLKIHDIKYIIQSVKKTEPKQNIVSNTA